MAKGDLVVFEQFLEDEARKVHNLQTDVIKVALIKSAANGGYDPVGNEADPRWAAGGTPNLAASEVTPAGGNYTAGGVDIAATAVETGGTMTFDGVTEPSWAANASNPSDLARWAIGYNDTAANKNAVFWVDLGGDVDMRAGPLDIQWGAGGIFQKTETPGV